MWIIIVLFSCLKILSGTCQVISSSIAGLPWSKYAQTLSVHWSKMPFAMIPIEYKLRSLWIVLAQASKLTLKSIKQFYCYILMFVWLVSCTDNPASCLNSRAENLQSKNQLLVSHLILVGILWIIRRNDTHSNSFSCAGQILLWPSFVCQKEEWF